MASMIWVMECFTVPPFNWNRAPCLFTREDHFPQLLDIFGIPWSPEADSHDGYRYARFNGQVCQIIL